MGENIFRFKRFAVAHGRSSLKVGIDAVLLGAWAGVSPRTILDVGTGCGVISLILAQRFPEAKIKGIDIDSGSIAEATENFMNSPWKENLECEQGSYPEILLESDFRYDLIVSNPPYFKSGISNPITSRELARHQSSLSVFSIVKTAPAYLNEQGRLSVIFPMEFYEEVLKCAGSVNLDIIRICKIRDNVRRPEKRVMMEFLKTCGDLKSEVKIDSLTMFEKGIPTEEYRRLCEDFYLRF